MRRVAHSHSSKLRVSIPEGFRPADGRNAKRKSVLIIVRAGERYTVTKGRYKDQAVTIMKDFGTSISARLDSGEYIAVNARSLKRIL